MGRDLPSVRKNAILNSIRVVLSIAFPLITYPYVTRVLQAENLGKVNFASSTMSYFSLLAVLGLTIYAGREGIRYRDNQIKLDCFCSELLTLNICTTVFAYICLAVTIAFIPGFQNYKGLLLIYSSTILFSTLGMEWIYTIFEDYAYITKRSIVFQIISVVLMFVFVRKKTDFYIYAAINVLASVGSNIFNCIHARKYISPRIVFNKKIFSHLKHSIIFFANSIASTIYSNIDMTMLGMMCSNYNVGIYSVSVKIYTMIKSVLVAIMSVTAPRLTYYKFNKMEEQFNKMASKLLKTMIVFLFPVVVGINLTANEIILVISGEGYIDSVVSLRILSFAILVSILASITSNILLSCKKERIVFKGTSLAAFTNFVINLIVIPVYKQNGAAFTTFLAELVVFLVGLYNARKDVTFDRMWKTLKESCIGCLAMIGVAWIIRCFVHNMVMELVLKVTICSIIYFLILTILKNDVVGEYWEIIKMRWKENN
ncbi:flippase [Dorea formicigenerans]|uniref:Flippase n=1 Tax=Dorea formicigenerans TaxID=39486 RepID=A0A412EZR1_9FIRM|nr:flippase [Dorea formicigenerans]RGR58484.1 flippase [Dorea formicigenerans]